MGTGVDDSTRPLPLLGRLLPGLFYGWVVAFGSALVAFVCVGIGFYSITVLLDALVETRGWSRASVSGASTLYFVVTGVTGTFVGRAIDRYGGRAWIAGGACLLGAGLVLVGQVTAPWQLYAVYTLMAVGFSMSSNVPTTALITRWFMHLRVRAMSVSQTGVSLGGIVIVPLATGLIQTEGLGFATRVLAGLVVGISLPVTLLVLRWDPGDHGLEPDGSRAPRVDNPMLEDAVQRRVWTLREALGTSTFWLLAAAFSAILFSQVGMLVHELAFLRQHLSPATAALGVSTTAAGSLLGRLVVGAFADRVEKRWLCMALFGLQACALIGFTLARGPAALYIAAFAFGSTIGNIFMMQGLLVGEMFGIPSYGRVFGMLQLLTQVAGVLGPVGVALAFEWSGGYAGSARLLAAFCAVALLLVSRIRPASPPLAGTGPPDARAGELCSPLTRQDG
jgi:MFS family permease